MGLSGAKQKQRIPEDPRNVRWATDTSAPGFKLLSSMGWTPDAPNLGLAASQDLIAAGGSTAYNKKISVIPLAKDDNLGIGARRGGAIGSIRAMGVPAIGGMGMGFVTASGGSGEPQEAPKQGGEFGRLLERLNKAKEEALLAAKESGAPVVEVEVAIEDKQSKEERKKAKKEKKRKRAAEEEEEEQSSAGNTESDAPVATLTTVMEVSPAPSSGASTPTILKNPRMAARSKHLRAKRLAAGNSAAMAEILGIAPTPSPSSSGASTPIIPHQGIPSTGLAPSAFGSASAGGGIGSSATAKTSEPPSISPPSTEGWPTAPPRAFPTFASASTTGLAATFDPSTTPSSSSAAESPASAETPAPAASAPAKPSGMAAYASMFSRASTSSIPSTFDSPAPAPVVVEEVVVEEKETEKQRLKREKKEAKALKKAAKALKGGKEEEEMEEKMEVDAAPAPAPQAAVEEEDEEVKRKREKKERKAEKEAKKLRKEAKRAKKE